MLNRSGTYFAGGTYSRTAGFYGYVQAAQAEKIAVLFQYLKATVNLKKKTGPVYFYSIVF